MKPVLTKIKVFSFASIATVLSVFTVSAQMPPGNPINLPGMLTITVTNPLDSAREHEPVIIPLSDILAKAPDFNRSFFRIKDQALMFEPLDLPSQIVRTPGTREREDIVFQVDIGPRGKKTLLLQYNPTGSNPPTYPARVRAYEKWYTGGTNMAWESELVAYRTYSGVVDYFAKSYPHLRLHEMPPDSYHHEATWGVDPFVIGKKPGLCGIAIYRGTAFTPFYGNRETVAYTHTAFADGPVCAGVKVGVSEKDVSVLDEFYTIFSERQDNRVRITTAGKDGVVAAGVQKNDGEKVKFDPKAGYLVTQALAGEYGSIGLAIAFDPALYAGMDEREDGRFIKLKTGPDGAVSFSSLAVWYRVSAPQPAAMDALVAAADRLSKGMANPLKVMISK